MALVFTNNQSLKPLNSFGFDQSAELFAQLSNEDEIEEAVRYAAEQKHPLTVLGGGSNLVIVSDISGLVIQPTDSSIDIQKLSDTCTHVIAGAGVNWHSLVQTTLAHDIPGLENLSLIPGSVGAAPVQNIGAYGVEVQDRIHSVRALHIPSMQWQTLSPAECRFSYRHSLFKEQKGEFIISQVTFSLGYQHERQTCYASLQQHLTDRKLPDPRPSEVAESVIAIRQARLPDPNLIGNAGSFFHNPKISPTQYQSLKEQFPKLPSYPQADGSVKVAAGWLIDNLGLKGFAIGGIRVHEDQALVLVNPGGNGTGREVLELAEHIKGQVFDHYGIELNIEPEVINR